MSGTLKTRYLVSQPPSPSNLSTSKRHENLGERIAGFVSAFITVCLISGLYFTHLFFVFLPWMESRVKDGYSYNDTFGIFLWIGMGFMSLFVFMGFWSFTMALLTDNRVKVDEDENEDVKNNVNNTFKDDYDEVKTNKSISGLRIKRWCKKCNLEKPIRAHHCSVCNACILRMNHHCPWINNCVGYRNHGHYLRFLFYVIAAMITGLVLMTCRMIFFKGRYMYWDQNEDGSWIMKISDGMLQMAFLVSNLAGCGILSLLIGLLFSVQLVNASHGHTAIESLEINQCEKDMRRERKHSGASFEFSNVEILAENEKNHQKETESYFSFPFPYDLGFDSNLKAVFGKNKLLWPFPLPIEMNPLSGSAANGKKFETRPDALINGQWPLPSKDPLLVLKHSRRGSLDDGGGYIVKNHNYSLQTQTQNQNK